MGQGAKPKGETNYVMATLFPGKEGLELFDQKIGSRIERLPGFVGFKGLTERIAPIVQRCGCVAVVSYGKRSTLTNEPASTDFTPAGTIASAVVNANATKSDEPPHFKGKA